MKKFYSIFVMAIAMLAFATQANAATITLNVDDASRVEVKVDNVTVELQSGVDKSVEINDGSYVEIRGTEGNWLSSVQRRGSYFEPVYYNTFSQYISSASDFDGVIWDVESVSLDESRDGEVTINVVDDASVVACELNNTGTSVELVNGENKVKYISTGDLCELPITIRHKYYENLYKVTLNGVPVEAENGSFYVTPTSNEDVIEVTANFPDIDVPVSFAYSEGAEGYITGVYVDDEVVTNYNDENFTVKLGAEVTIYFDRNNYMLDSFVVNGESVSVYSSYTFTVTNETGYNIEVNAHLYGTITAYVTVDDINNVTVYRGYSSSGDVVALESGVKTAVELSENNPLLSWKVASGCYIESVKVITESGEEDKTGSSFLSNVAAGTEIVITTGVIVRDQTAILWIDDKSLASNGGAFQIESDRYLFSFDQLATGYNTVNFSVADNPFNFGAYGLYPVVYQNDAVIDDYYDSGRYYITFADGDVVKAFFATATPATYGVAFEVAENVPAITCKKDIITEVADWQSGFSALQGTQVDLVAESAVNVTVNGNAVTAGEGNTYTFTVDAETTVKIDADDNAIDGIEVDAVSDNNVYNLQGILVVKNATAEQIDALPAGMYIINGKKVVLK